MATSVIAMLPRRAPPSIFFGRLFRDGGLDTM